MGFLGLSKKAPNVPAQQPVQQDVEKADHHHQQPTITADKYDSDTTSDTLSLEARNELEVEQHPDQVTADAHIGVQKAEAAALVWGKPALIFIYAWYLFISSLP
jgi:formate-dependent nitrite reductase cytochrome c552 subunit